MYNNGNIQYSDEPIIRLQECFENRKSTKEEFEKEYWGYVEKNIEKKSERLERVAQAFSSKYEWRSFQGWRSAYLIFWGYCKWLKAGNKKADETEPTMQHILEDNMEAFDVENPERFLVLEICLDYFYKVGKNIKLFWPLRQTARLYSIICQMNHYYEECNDFYGEEACLFLLDQVLERWSGEELKKTKREELNGNVYYLTAFSGKLDGRMKQNEKPKRIETGIQREPQLYYPSKQEVKYYTHTNAVNTQEDEEKSIEEEETARNTGQNNSCPNDIPGQKDGKKGIKGENVGKKGQEEEPEIEKKTEKRGRQIKIQILILKAAGMIFLMVVSFWLGECHQQYSKKMQVEELKSQNAELKEQMEALQQELEDVQSKYERMRNSENVKNPWNVGVGISGIGAADTESTEPESAESESGQQGSVYEVKKNDIEETHVLQREYNFRSEPDEYAEVYMVLGVGMSVEVLQVMENEWVQVQYNGIVGYIKCGGELGSE